MPDHRPDPKLRWHTETVTRAPVFVVPGDSSSSGPVKPMGKTWGMRVSGDTGGWVAHSYRCPVHGLFEAEVPRADVPDVHPCRHGIEADGVGCGVYAPWAGSSCAIGIESGMVTG